MNESVKFLYFFSEQREKRKPIHVPIVEKIRRLERAQYVFLDHSKTLFLVTSSK